MSAPDVHGSWRRAVLLALPRSEQGPIALDRGFDVLAANGGALLADLIRLTGAADSESSIERLVAAGIDRASIPGDFRQPTTLSWARLLFWLLARLDQIDAPVGLDAFHIFKQWLAAYMGRDDLAPMIVTRIHHWLVELEDWDRPSEPTQAARLFAYDGRYGRACGLTQDLRTQFLLFCAATPALAESYLRSHTGDGQYDEVVDDILNFSTAAGQVAPGALADCTIDALITAEARYEERHGRSHMGRLSMNRHALHPASPGKGPFLSVLRGSSAEGLRLVRRILDYGLGLDQRSNSSPPQFLTIDSPRGVLPFSAPGSYFLSRTIGAGSVMTIALRALEAWGYEQVDSGRPVMDVVDEILGENGGPAAFLGVAMDVLLSHTLPADPSIIPFLASPELLRLDFDRFTRDRAGLAGLEGEAGFKVPGLVPTFLTQRGSRQTCLQWAAADFLIRKDEAQVDEIRRRLTEARARLEADAEDESCTTHDPRWHADQVLRRLDWANWRSVTIELADGRMVPGWNYEPPAEEGEIVDPQAAEAASGSKQMVLIHELVNALIEPDKRSAKLLDDGLRWARSLSLDEMSEDPEDFEAAQHWRAMVAAASLVMLSPNHGDDRPWARTVLEKAIVPTELGRHERVIAQLRFHAAGLASLGWAKLAREGDSGAQAALLMLATRQDSALIAAIGGALTDLSTSNDRLPQALVRLALCAAIFAERNWDDPDAEAREKAARDVSLASAIVAEKAWLARGEEPNWPSLPLSRRLKRGRRTISLPVLKEDVDWDDDAGDSVDHQAQLPDPFWFNHQTGGAWLVAVERQKALCETPWVADFIRLYRPWSLNAWGAGLPEDADLSDFPTEWLAPFERIFLRTHANVGLDTFEE